MVIYMCAEGFVLQGSEINMCTASGGWTQETAPSCLSNCKSIG